MFKVGDSVQCVDFSNPNGKKFVKEKIYIIRATYKIEDSTIKQLVNIEGFGTGFFRASRFIYAFSIPQIILSGEINDMPRLQR